MGLDRELEQGLPVLAAARHPRRWSELDSAEVIARLDDGSAVAARQGRWLVTSFHPELSDDDRFHRYFLNLVEGK